MKTSPLCLIVLVAGIVCISPALAQTPDSRLTLADVEKVSGIKGIQQVGPGSVVGAGPGLNFTGPDKKMVLMVNFGPAALYQRAKTQTLPVTNQPIFHADVRGIGDEAFDSPPGPLQYVLYVRKGANAISLTAYYVGKDKATLTIDQLKQLAMIIVSRM
jgi:hypothetical protein